VKYLTRILVILLALAACDLLLCAWYGHMARSHFGETNLSKADCAIVFFNDFRGDWTINDETIRRCNHALSQFRNHKISAIMCSGGSRPRHGKSGARLMAQWLSERGVPSQGLHVEVNSCETVGNIRNSMKMLNALGYRSVLFMSSPLHLYRIDFLLSGNETSHGIRVGFSPYPYRGISPALNTFEALKQTHYEWISFTLYLLLPKGLYNRIIYHIRGCRPGAEGLSGNVDQGWATEPPTKAWHRRANRFTKPIAHFNRMP
jgi:uncharacterized SAM-binding protein YcdF (DUF218 family)